MITDAVAANYLFMVFLFLFGWIILKTQFSFSIIHSSCSVLIVIGIVILIQPFKGITSITGYDTTQLVIDQHSSSIFYSNLILLP